MMTASECLETMAVKVRPVTVPSMGCRLREDLDRGTGTIGPRKGGVATLVWEFHKEHMCIVGCFLIRTIGI
jgi:hypothetical protein